MSALELLKDVVRATRVPSQESAAEKALERIREMLAAPSPPPTPEPEPEREALPSPDRKRRGGRTRASE